MRAGAEIVGPSEKRTPYAILLGGGNTNSHYHFRWTCPACGYAVEECESAPDPETARQVAQVKADAHSCNYGWCAVPMTEERLMLAEISPVVIGSLPRYEWTPTELNRLREYARGSA